MSQLVIPNLIGKPILSIELGQSESFIVVLLLNVDIALVDDTLSLSQLLQHLCSGLGTFEVSISNVSIASGVNGVHGLT